MMRKFALCLVLMMLVSASAFAGDFELPGQHILFFNGTPEFWTAYDTETGHKITDGDAEFFWDWEAGCYRELGHPTHTVTFNSDGTVDESNPPAPTRHGTYTQP